MTLLLPLWQVSATIPNIADIAEWLKVPPAGVFGLTQHESVQELAP